MPKKRKKKIKHILKGYFYHIHEGSPTGHPGMVYWKNDKRNLYLALTTDSSSGEHRTKLSEATDETVEQSFVYNRPLLAKRRDIGGIRTNVRFDKNDKSLLRVVSRRIYRETNSINRKDRRYLKSLKKKPKY